MINLDNREQIEALDSKKMLQSLELLSDQVREVTLIAELVKMPSAYKNCDRIVVLGMGGSTLGSHIVKSVFADELAQPLEIVNGYAVPAFVNKKTLVLVSSYSGGTEEPLAAMQAALKQGAKVMVITSGGTLADAAKKHTLPALIFTTKNNPCGSPRMGLGYSIIGQIILFSKAGVIGLNNTMLNSILKTLEYFDALCGVETDTVDNPAKLLAKAIGTRSVWYVGAEHLAGSAHTAANQLNENAKRFGGYFLIPELNHHLMEGLMYPKTNANTMAFVLLESGLYDKRIQKRFSIMQDITKKNGVDSLVYKLESKTPLLQAVESLVVGSYVSFYLAMLEGIDPTAIPFVDFFKAALKK